MSWLLDTNACIRYLNGRSLTLKRRIDSTNEAEISVCSIVKAELCFGAQRSTKPQLALSRQQRFLLRFRSFAFDDRCAEEYGRIRAALASSPIGPNDLLIAAIAVANDLTLVTNNTGEFSRVPGLRHENWEVD